MNTALLAADKSGLGSASFEVEVLLAEFDLFRAILDEWLELETTRNNPDLPLEMSSTFRVIVERFALLDEAARRVLRP